jgi:hypothetical protein
MKLNLPSVFQVLGASLVVAQTAVSQETIAEVASGQPDFTTLVGLVTLDNPAIEPILARLTGDDPTSKLISVFRITMSFCVS